MTYDHPKRVMTDLGTSASVLADIDHRLQQFELWRGDRYCWKTDEEPSAYRTTHAERSLAEAFWLFTTEPLRFTGYVYHNPETRQPNAIRTWLGQHVLAKIVKISSPYVNYGFGGVKNERRHLTVETPYGVRYHGVWCASSQSCVNLRKVK